MNEKWINLLKKTLPDRSNSKSDKPEMEKKYEETRVREFKLCIG